MEVVINVQIIQFYSLGGAIISSFLRKG